MRETPKGTPRRKAGPRAQTTMQNGSFLLAGTGCTCYGCSGDVISHMSFLAGWYGPTGVGHCNFLAVVSTATHFQPQRLFATAVPPAPPLLSLQSTTSPSPATTRPSPLYLAHACVHRQQKREHPCCPATTALHANPLPVADEAGPLSQLAYVSILPCNSIVAINHVSL